MNPVEGWHVEFLVGKQGVRDKTRPVEDYFAVLDTTHDDTERASGRTTELIQIIAKEFHEERRKLVTKGHDFSPSYFDDRGYYRVAAVILGAGQPGSPVPFSVSHLFLKFHPPTSPGERPVICRKADEVKKLLQLLRPDLDDEEIAQTPISAYMARCAYNSNVVFIVDERIQQYSYRRELCYKLGIRGLLDCSSGAMIRAKLSGGDGLSRSQHKITYGKFIHLFGPSVADTALLDSFFEVRKRKRDNDFNAPRPTGVIADKLNQCGGMPGYDTEAGKILIGMAKYVLDWMKASVVDFDKKMVQYAALPPKALLMIMSNLQSLDGLVREVVDANSVISADAYMHTFTMYLKDATSSNK